MSEYYVTIFFLASVNQITAQNKASLLNRNFELTVTIDTVKVNVKITDLKYNAMWADGIYNHQLEEIATGELEGFSGLKLPSLECHSDRIRIRRLIGDFEIEHDLILATESPLLAEEMKIVNLQGIRRNVSKFSASFSKNVTGTNREILKNHIQCRLVSGFL